MGLGWLAITAARMAREGATASAIIERVKDLRKHARIYALIDTLKYLRKGGRANAVVAGMYYATQRLLKARRWSEAVSRFHVWGWPAISVAAAAPCQAEAPRPRTHHAN